LIYHESLFPRERNLKRWFLARAARRFMPHIVD
jgi:hypothetical protein